MLDFTHLWAEPFPIPFHAILALAAIVLGAVQLIGVKGTVAHKIIGYTWVGLMAGTAVSAIFIHEIRIWGPFSPIHLLIPVVLISLWVGVRAARQEKIKQHRGVMVRLFTLALIVTGFFTLLPGRTMHAVLFGGG